jgi:3-(3-hydroxy-phenyl)propionate hydroxylase
MNTTLQSTPATTRVRSPQRNRQDKAADGFVYPRFEYRTPPDLKATKRLRYPIVIVGAGMVGLTAAADFGSRGIACLVLDDNDTVAGGSRAIAQARKSLQVWDRSGSTARMKSKGLDWNFARHLYGDREVSAYELYPESGNKFPPMTILPQYYVESYLVERCSALPEVEIRWKNAVERIVPKADHVEVHVSTPEGPYVLEADWLIAADGVKSVVRSNLGLEFQGTRIEDRFIIVDVIVDDDFPPGRSFWFKQPFHEGNSTLFLRQPENVCRVDFNIGPDANAELEMTEERLRPKLQAMFGPDKEFDIRWVSLYTVEVRRMEKFRHGRVFFVGDSAHQVSPFSGGRGGNSGVEDADNLCWKLARVVQGRSPESLLDSYDDERIPIADENIRYSLRATEFISPSSPASDLFQTATLTLAASMPFARSLINSGRFSTTAIYADSPLSAADVDAAAFAQPRTAPGCAAVDAPVEQAGETRSVVEVLGLEFCLMAYQPEPGWETRVPLATLAAAGIPLTLMTVTAAPATDSDTSASLHVTDAAGLLAQRYGLTPGSCYLFRPDQRIAGRWKDLSTAPWQHALRRAASVGDATS